MNIPLVSVVIPTHNRPQFLPRAVNSALASAPDGAVEVIVVPNGSDASWKKSLTPWVNDARVRVSPIATAHANIARNHGMALATAEYIRFLDDDDYLLSETSIQQLEHLAQQRGDLSFANIEVRNSAGEITTRAYDADSDDFVACTLARIPCTVPLRLLYRRQFLYGLRWCDEVERRQDVYWAYDICERSEPTAVFFNKAVGVWVWHDDAHISFRRHKSSAVHDKTARLLALIKSLQQQGRMNECRDRAAAGALWQCVHQGLVYNLGYWRRVAAFARRLSPQSNPGTPIYDNIIVSRLNPLMIELTLVPIRRIRLWLGHEYKL